MFKPYKINSKKIEFILPNIKFSVLWKNSIMVKKYA